MNVSDYITNHTSVTDSACTFDTVSNTNNSYIFKVPETGDLISATPTYVSIEGERNNDNLVGYWDFDYTGNSAVAYDSSGKGNDGTVSNAVYSDDTHNGTGSSMYFDGDGDYVSANTNGWSAIAMTISMWYKPNEHKANYPKMIRHYNSGNRVYIMHRNNNYSVQLGSSSEDDTGYSFVLNEWVYLTLSYNSTNWFAYVNSIQVDTNTYIGLSSFASSFNIGGADYINGTIDQVSIYNKALSESEIQYNYQNGLKRHPNITNEGMNTTNSDWFGQETVSVTSEYLGEQNLTRITYSNPYPMTQYDLWSTNLTEHLGWNPNLIGNRFWYSTYTGNTDNSTLKDTSDYTQWFDSCSQGNTTGQVLCLNFNELQGTTAKDSSDEGNDGTLTNMNTGYNNGSSGWTTDGYHGNALDFDGVDDYVELGSRTVTGSHSISVWIKMNDCTDGAIYADGDTSNQVIFWFDDDGACGRIGYRQELGGGGVTKYGNTNFAIGIWYHVGISCNSTHCNYYLNGNYDGGGLHDNINGLVINDPNIGSDSVGGKYFNGTIDEVRIFNRALSASEITTAYEAGAERLGIMPNQEGGLTAGTDWDIFVVNSTIDTTIPEVIIQQPLNKTYLGGNIWFNLTCADIGNGCDTAVVEIDNINYTMTNSSGNYNYKATDLSDGSHDIRFYVNDTGIVNNMNDTETVIYSIGNFTVEYPANDTFIRLWVWNNVTLPSDVEWCGYSLDSASNITLDNDTTTHYYKNISGLSNDTSYNIMTSCNDTMGNIESQITYFSIDDSIITTKTISLVSGYNLIGVTQDITMSDLADLCSSITSISARYNINGTYINYIVGLSTNENYTITNAESIWVNSNDACDITLNITQESITQDLYFGWNMVGCVLYKTLSELYDIMPSDNSDDVITHDAIWDTTPQQYNANTKGFSINADTQTYKGDGLFYRVSSDTTITRHQTYWTGE